MQKQATPKNNPLYSLGEELCNAITHGAGALLAAAAIAIMVLISALQGDGWKLASSIVYGVTMLFMYMSSTLYHAVPHEGAKRILRSFDHCSIFLLIAGTYTPLTLVAMRDSVGLWLFAAIWGLALLGIVLNVISIERFNKVSMVLYLLMGWAVVFAARPLVNAVSVQCIWLMVAGGLAYTLGVIFYSLKKIKYMHAVWHLFVLAGSVLHFLAITMYVL